MQDLGKIINKEVTEFQSKEISIVPGFMFNQKRTIETIFFYHNSRFTTGSVDDDGDRKYFYNINRNPCKVFSKAIDFDTKNIRLLTTGGGDTLKTWFMERDLKYWMRDKQFGKVLNRIFRELPIYGSVVLKIVDGTPYFVDLRNFIVEQGADSLPESNYIVEIHNMTPGEFRKVGKQMKWKDADIKQTIKQFHEKKDSHIRVYERYGEVEDEKGNWTYRRSYFADVAIDQLDEVTGKTTTIPGIELASDEFDAEKLKTTYWEFHKDKIPGRWLGVGVVEELFEPQIKQNEIANLQGKSAYWNGLKIFQTRDGTFNRNLATGAQNGEVLTVESEITPVNMQEQNGAFFNEETRKWMTNRDELTFSYDAVQGERSPAGTPLGSTQISISQTLSYFEGIQEEIAMDIKEMIYQVIIPQFQKEMTKEHVLRLVGQDLDQYIAMVTNELVMKEVIRTVLNGGNFPTNQEKDVMAVAVGEAVKQGKEKLLTIPKDFFKNIKYDVDIDITGESIDTRVRSATLFALLQAITSDPTMTTDPVKKKFLYKMCEDGGINPNELFDVEQKSIDNMMPEMSPLGGRAGGGVSAPAMGASMPGQQMATV